MKATTPLSLHLRLGLTALCLFGFTLVTRAHGTASGTIEGRVFDAGRDEFLEKVRLTIEGTNGEAFTDAMGHDRVTNVPAGPVTLRVSYTGLSAQTETVNAAELQRAREWELSPPVSRGDYGGIWAFGLKGKS